MRLLANNSSPGVRADVATKIARGLVAKSFTESESAIAMDILRILAVDMEVSVRKSLSESLCDSQIAPHDVIMRLANDVAEVAVPVLQYSYVLSEDELIQIVRSTREVVKLSAIARRETISLELSEVLADTGEQKVLHTLLHNRGAYLADGMIEKRWDMLTGNPSLLEALVQRGGLSVSIAEKLFAIVTDEMKQHLARNYRLPMTLVEHNVEDIREWNTLGMLMPDNDEHRSEQEIESLVHQLYTSNRLTYSLIIRSLCTGDLSFFEAALARLAGVPRANARMLMFDSGPLGFRAFYKKAHMPEGFYDAIRLLIRISLELTQYGRVRREDFRQRVVAKIRSEGYDESIENMQYLLAIIGGQNSAGATIH